MDRQRLKEWAKSAFHRSYWKSVLVAFILTIAAGTGASGGSGGSSSSSGTNYGTMTDQEIAILLGIILVALIVSFVIWLIGALIKAFLFNPLQVGCQAYFCDGLYNTEPSLGLMGKGFKENYKNVTKGMFLKDLYLWLWSLIWTIPVVGGAIVLVLLGENADNTGNAILFIVFLIIYLIVAVAAMIPYIYKTYEYLLVPYILADNPDMPGKEAITLSKQMMMGDKWNAFVLQLSFLGWILLSGCTCGILSIFYVEPYRCYTFAAFYKTMQQKMQRMNGYYYNEV